MKVQKNSLLVLTAVALAIIALSIFWAPSFFVDQFYNVSIAYTEKGVSITPTLQQLENASISRWTEVSVTFKNGSSTLCQVEVQSSSLSRNFAIEKKAEYGLLLPKHEAIAISFCGVKQDIRVD